MATSERRTPPVAAGLHRTLLKRKVQFCSPNAQTDRFTGATGSDWMLAVVNVLAACCSHCQLVVDGDVAGGHGGGTEVLFGAAAAVGAVEIGNTGDLLDGL